MVTKPVRLHSRHWSRRGFVKSAGSAAMLAGAGAFSTLPRPARAKRKTLKILQWKHFVPAYDEWFNNHYVKEWGERNNTEVIVNNVGMTSLKGRADAEVAAQNGYRC